MPNSTLDMNCIVISGGLLCILALIGWIVYLKLSLKKLQKSQLKFKKKSKANIEFITTLSHELRTPLYAVTTISKSLLENSPKNSQLEDLHILNKASSYLVRLINDALLIKKMDAKKLGSNQENFDLKDLLDSVIKTTQNQAQGLKNEILIKKDPQLPKLLKGDTLKISQILINLISNAIKFGNEKPIYVTVDLIEKKSHTQLIQFSVTDQGKGILAADKIKILNRFHQVDNIKTDFGSGLGLPIVVQLLKSLDSELFISSELEKGSAFSFKINLANADSEPKHTQLIHDERILDNKNILVVDDNLVNQALTQKTLAKKGIKTQGCNNGKDAIELIKNNHFHMVLMDLYMPEMSGEEATKIIRSFNDQIPIIALTAIDKIDHWNELEAQGFSAILNKPYEESDLFNTLIHQLETRGSDS